MREMMEFTSNEFTSDVTYADSPDEDDYEPVDTEPNSSTSNFIFNEGQVRELPQVCPLNSHTVKDYFSKAGVAILPEIPEEMEDNPDEVGDNNFINAKRISRISAKLEELNQKHNHVEILNISDLVVSKQQVGETEKIDNIEYISDYKDNNRNFLVDIETMKIKSCCSCPTYRIFIWKRKFRFCKDFMMDHFCRPLQIGRAHV